MTLPALIDGLETYEVVQGQVAAILKAESLSQQALATAAGKDPRDWEFRVFEDRTEAWDEFKEPDSDGFVAPLISITANTETFDKSRSAELEQGGIASFNLDCMGYGQACAVGGGHEKADHRAEREAKRASGLVRRILMAGPYMRLGFDASFIDLVGDRWISQRTFSRVPQPGSFQIMCARLVLEVEVTETSQAMQPVTLKKLLLNLTKDTTTGELLAAAEYPKE